MGKTIKHRDISKFKNNIYDYEDLDINIKKKFNRDNWNIGESRKNKKLKTDKILFKQLKKDLDYDDEN